jgi:tRNA threonylcarbamoyladenosine biosynthesis protein TsaB
MSLILNIDTAMERASIYLAKNDIIFETAYSENQKDHAAWLHLAIDGLLKKSQITVSEIKAVAVSIGPGSYTGLRVGLSAAKGLCYALNIPLITVNSLHMLAYAVQKEATDLIVPVIDARRMEIYTAVYKRDLTEKTSAHTLIVEEGSFHSLLQSHKILFCGNAIDKLKKVIKNENASCSDTMSDAGTLARMAKEMYLEKKFADLAYSEPLYVKESYFPAFKK